MREKSVLTDASKLDVTFVHFPLLETQLLQLFIAILIFDKHTLFKII